MTKHPIPATLFMIGIFFLVALPVVTVILWIAALWTFLTHRARLKQAHEEAVAKAVARRDRELIIAMKSLGR